jgi:hypothetical protein
MPAAVRYTWMFRTAAAVFVFFGVVWLWRFGLTDYHPEQRPYGLAGGVVALLTGVFLVRGARFAIALSALAAAIVGVCATAFAPTARGPVILFAAALALICVLYAVLAARVLLQNRS